MTYACLCNTTMVLFQLALRKVIRMGCIYKHKCYFGYQRMFQAPQTHEINFSNLAQLGDHQYHISQDKSAYHKQGLLNLFVKGHIPAIQLKAIAAELNYPAELTKVRHLVAYENYSRDKTAAKPEWVFTGYSLHPHYETQVVNGRAVAKEALYVELHDQDIACSLKPVPVTALFYCGLKSPLDSTDYLEALIELDMQTLVNHFGKLPAPHELHHFANENKLAAFERPLFIEVMDKETGEFVFATLPSTDIDQVINQIKHIAETGVYGNGREISYREDGKPYVSLNYDSQSISFTQHGNFGEHDYLVQRIITAMKRGYAPRINQLDNDSHWFDFSRETLGNNLFVKLPVFTELDHI